MRSLFLLLVTLGVLSGSGPTASAAPPTPAPEKATEMPLEVEPFAEFVAPQDSLPHLRFLADGLITLNDRCPVRKVRLNPRMGASYVNGRPVGFC
jgi:hypothetical protein